MRKRLIREKTMSFTTHFSIVGHLKEEEDSSWERFFQTYGPLIRMHGKDCGVPEGALDDLVQNVMLSVFKQSKRFEYDPARGRFRDYLRMIIRARANDFFRELYREERAVRAVPEMECQLDNLYAAEWEEHDRRESLKKLREVSSARHFSDFSHGGDSEPGSEGAGGVFPDAARHAVFHSEPDGGETAGDRPVFECLKSTFPEKRFFRHRGEETGGVFRLLNSPSMPVRWRTMAPLTM